MIWPGVVTGQLLVASSSIEQEVRDGCYGSEKTEQRKRTMQLQWKVLLRELVVVNRKRWNSLRTMVEESVAIQLEHWQQWRSWQTARQKIFLPARLTWALTICTCAL